MEESKIREVVRNSGKEIMQILKEETGDDVQNTIAVERFLKFTLNEARDERQIASSKKFVYDIAIVVIDSLMEMIIQEKESGVDPDTFVTNK